MIKSMENTDQDDFFDFLRSDDDPLSAGHDYRMKDPSKMTSGLGTAPMTDPLSQSRLKNKKRNNILS